MRGGLIAMDLNGTRSGVAFGDADSPRPHCTSWDMPTGDLPRACGGLITAIYDLSKLIKPAVVAIEAPVPIPNRRPETSLILTSLYGAAAGAAYAVGAKVVDGHISTVRKHFVGKGNLSSDDAAQAIADRCRQLGWEIHNHDEGDAAALWCWAMSTNFPRWVPNGTPLFGRSAA